MAGGAAVEAGAGITKKGKGGRKAANPAMSDEQRRQERVLKNRVSAMKSLQKKKRYTDDLEKRAKLLTAQNIDLKTRIYALVAKLAQSGVNVGFGGAGAAYDPLLQALLAQHNHAYSYGVPPHIAAAAAAAHHQALVDSQQKQAMVAAAAAAHAQQHTPPTPGQAQPAQSQLPPGQLPPGQLPTAQGQLQHGPLQSHAAVSPLPQMGPVLPQLRQLNEPQQGQTALSQPQPPPPVQRTPQQSPANPQPSTSCTPTGVPPTPPNNPAQPGQNQMTVNPARQGAGIPPVSVPGQASSATQAAPVGAVAASGSADAGTAMAQPTAAPLVVKTEEHAALVKPEQGLAPIQPLSDNTAAEPILDGDALDAFSEAVLDDIDIDMGDSFLNVADAPDLSLLDDVDFTPTPQF